MPSFSDVQTFIYNEADHTKNITFDLSAMGSGNVSTVKAPALAGSTSYTWPFLESVQSWTDQQTFDDVNTASCPVIVNLQDAQNVNAAFVTINDIAGTGSLVFSASRITGSRTVLFDDIGGLVALCGNASAGGALGVVNVTAQTADIAAANLVTGLTGAFRVTYMLEDTTSAVGAGAVTLTLSWTDDAGATTATATQVLTSTGRQSGSVVAYVASGNLTYATSHTGIFSTSRYALRIRVEALG